MLSTSIMSVPSHAFMNGSNGAPNGFHTAALQPTRSLAPRAQTDVIDLTSDSPSPYHSPYLSPFDNLGALPPTPPPSMGVRVVKGKALPSPTIPDYFDPIKASGNNTSDSSSITRKPTPPTVAPVKRKAEERTPKAGPSSQPATTTPPRAAEGIARLRPFLEPIALRGSRPKDLFNDLVKDEDSGKAKVQLNAQDLLEVVQQLSKHASMSYLQLMADEEDFTEVISIWLRRFKKDPVLHANSIAPLLNVLSITNMPVNYIEDYDFVPMIKDIVAQCIKMTESKMITLPAIRSAYNKYMKYYQNVLLPKNRRVLDPDSDDDDKPIVKRVKPTPKPAAKLDNVKIEKKKAEPARKSDLTFFGVAPSVPKPRPRQTSDIKPVPAPTGKPSLLNSTMAMLKNKEQAAPAYQPRGVKAEDPVGATKPKGAKLNKKGHTVMWRDLVERGPLEDFRPFREESWEHEMPPWKVGEDGLHGMSIKELEVQEAQLMHRTHWTDPEEYDIPNWNPDTPRPPLHTPEVTAQDERERTVLSTTYLMNDIPATPDESDVRISREDVTTKHLNVRPAQPPAPAVPDISSLLSNLGNIPFANPAPYAQEYARPPQPQAQTQNRWGPAALPPSNGYTYQSSSQPGYTGYGYTPGYTPGNASPYNNGYGNNNNNSSYTNTNANAYNGYDYRPATATAPRQLGVPSSKKKKPCRFWLANGSCTRGDECYFAHGRD